MGSSGSQSPPKAPDFAKTYQSGIDVYLKNLPNLLNTEAATRATTDPARVQQQQDLQHQFGPQQYQQQLDALHQIDPQSQAIRGSLATQVQSDLDAGYNLPPEYQRQLEQSVRGAEAARGNILGQGAGSLEAGVIGQAALQRHQQSLTNAGSFLAGPTPEQQILAVQPVQADRGFAYASPTAGAAGTQFGLSNYGNLLDQWKASGGGSNPWMSAAGGAASGAAAGSSFGPYGALIGGVAGGAAGYFSDLSLKEDVHHIVNTPSGPIVSFRYMGETVRRIGTIAQDVLKVRPDAVKRRSGFLTVDYDSINLPFFALKGAN